MEYLVQSVSWLPEFARPAVMLFLAVFFAGWLITGGWATIIRFIFAIGAAVLLIPLLLDWKLNKGGTTGWAKSVLSLYNHIAESAPQRRSLPRGFWGFTGKWALMNGALALLLPLMLSGAMGSEMSTQAYRVYDQWQGVERSAGVSDERLTGVNVIQHPPPTLKLLSSGAVEVRFPAGVYPVGVAQVRGPITSSVKALPALLTVRFTGTQPLAVAKPTTTAASLKPGYEYQVVYQNTSYRIRMEQG